MKQHSAHPYEVDHQLGSARHRVFRSFKPRTLSGRRISSDHMITTPRWIASSSPGLFSTIANWMIFLQLVRALSLLLYVVFLQCLVSSMLSTPIVLESLDCPFLLETAKFAIHGLYTEFVGRCTCLFQFICALAPFLPRYCQFHNDKVLCDWMTMAGLRDVWTMSGNCSFLSRSA